MELQIALAFLLMLFSVIWIFLNKYFQNIKKLPPGPTKIPIFGSLPFLPKEVKGATKRIQVWMNEQYGPISCFQMMWQQNFIFLSDIDLIKEVLKKSEASARPPREKPFHDFKFGDSEGRVRGIINSSGKEWQEQRRFTLKHLRDLGFGKSSMENSIQNEVDKLIELFSKNCGKPLNLNLKMNLAMLNALWYILVGESLELEDEKLHKVMSTVDRSVRIGGNFSIWNRIMMAIHPQLTRWFDKDYEKQKKLFDEINEIVQPYISNHQENIDPNDPKDFMDVYLNEISSTNDVNSSFYSKRGEESLISTMFDLFIAGMETTTSSLLWAILFLLHYPEVQAKVQTEIDDIVGSSRKVSLDDKSNLPYTNAVLHESLRMATITPMALPHFTTEDLEVRGYTIPKNSTIIADILNVHYNPNHWKDPEIFNPERFYENATNTFKNDDHLIPFSVGKRYCLGQSLAEKEYFLFFANLVQSFNFSTAPGKDLPPIGKNSGTMAGILRSVPIYEVILNKRT